MQQPSCKLGRICMDKFGGLSKLIIQPSQLLAGMWQLWVSKVNYIISVVLTESSMNSQKQATHSFECFEIGSNLRQFKEDVLK